MSHSWNDRRLVLVFLVCLFNLPFLLQAFHIDDRLFLEVADQILDEPLYPYRYEISFEGGRYPDTASGSHLPWTAYYLALLRLLFPAGREWVLHAAFLIFPVLAALAFYETIRRETAFAFASSLLLVLAPGVFTMSHTLMTDVPQLSFWLVAMAGFTRISQGLGRRRDWVFCMLGLSAAALTSYLAFGLVILFAACRLLHNRKRTNGSLPEDRRIWLLMLLPILIWAFWFAYSYAVYERFVPVMLSRHIWERQAFDGAVLLEKLTSFILNAGATVFFPLGLWLTTAATRPRLALSCLLLGISSCFFHATGWSLIQTVLFAIFWGSGILVFGLIAADWKSLLRGGGVPRMYFFMFWGILAACLLVFYMGAVRYTLLAVPPIIFLAVRSIERSRLKAGYAGRLIVLILLATIPYSLWIASADYRLAGAYRQAAARIVNDYEKPGRTIWFTAEWGLRYYFEQAGARLLLSQDPGPREGDIIVKPERAISWPTLYDSEDRVQLLEGRDLTTPGPLAVMDPDARAGFYSTTWGILPFSFSSTRVRDTLYVLQVSHSGPGLPAGAPAGPALSYRLLRTRIRDVVAGKFPPAAGVLVVARGDDVLLGLLGANFSHFPQSDDGSYLGYQPAESREALERLESLRVRGARFILFPETSRWWLEYYEDLGRYLRQEGELWIDEPGVAVAFRLPQD